MQGCPEIKILPAAVKDLIGNAKYLDTLTLAFQEQTPQFPADLLVDLAPHAQQIRALHITSQYSGERGDEGMLAIFELLPFLVAFPGLTHLVFTGVEFIFGHLYQAIDIDRLQPHLHTFPSVTSLDLDLFSLVEMGVLQINVLFPCLKTFHHIRNRLVTASATSPCRGRVRHIGEL